MSGPLFSVIIPTYEGGGRVPPAIPSVLAQTFTDYECLVVDDGSAAPAQVPEHPRIRFLRRDVNGGPGPARNTGCEAATGEFLVFLDDDDTWHPRRLEALARLHAERPDLDILTTDAVVVRPGRPPEPYYTTRRFPSEERQRDEILRWNFLFTSSALRRSRWNEIGGFSDRPACQDYDLWVRAVLSGARAGIVDEPLVEYHLSGTGVSGDRPRTFDERIRLLQAALARPDLSDAEREAAREQVRATERDRLVHAAQQAVRSGAPDARTRAWAVATTGGLSLPLRARSLAAVVAPGVARRLAR